MSSRHVSVESARRVTPGAVPRVTSMSSSKPASARKEASWKRVTYMVSGSQPPATRWSRKSGSHRPSFRSVASRNAVTYSSAMRRCFSGSIR